jgi:hypothetical protein
VKNDEHLKKKTLSIELLYPTVFHVGRSSTTSLIVAVCARTETPLEGINKIFCDPPTGK